jgi:hypothetical protein
MADVSDNVADVSNEVSRGVSETLHLVDAMGHRLNQAAQRGASETIDRAEATRHRLNQAAEGMFDDVLRAYQTFFSFREARRIAEAYIEINERMAKESLDFNRRFIELWFEGARKLWQAAEGVGA